MPTKPARGRGRPKLVREADLPKSKYRKTGECNFCGKTYNKAYLLESTITEGLFVCNTCAIKLITRTETQERAVAMTTKSSADMASLTHSLDRGGSRTPSKLAS